MTTALSIITSTLQEIGVAETGQSLDADDVNTCFLALNVLADAWLTAPNYAFATQMVSATLPGSTVSLSIGTGQAINTPRPVRLEDGCYIRTDSIDLPLRVITQAEYNAIPLKTIDGPWPSVCYYDSASPVGTVFFYPQGACTVYLNVQTQLSQFATLNTDYTLPPGYARAFALTLSEEVASKFHVQVNPLTMRNAKAARRDIKRANFVVPQLVEDPRNNVHLPIVGHDGTFDGGSA